MLAEGVLCSDVLFLLHQVCPALAVEPRFFTWQWRQESKVQQGPLGKKTLRPLFHSFECTPYKNWPDYLLYHSAWLGKKKKKSKTHSVAGVINWTFHSLPSCQMHLFNFQLLHSFHSENKYFRIICLVSNNYNTTRIYGLFHVRVKKSYKNIIIALFVVLSCYFCAFCGEMLSHRLTWTVVHQCSITQAQHYEGLHWEKSHNHFIILSTGSQKHTQQQCRIPCIQCSMKGRKCRIEKDAVVLW